MNSIQAHNPLEQTPVEGEELSKAQLIRRTLADSRGMSLIEILVVLAIIGLIVGGVSVVAFNQFDNAKIDTAKTEVQSLSSMVDMYRVQKNKCPKEMKDLKAAGILNRNKKDPWDTPYQLKCPGEKGAVDISSAGPDKEFGTADDINNWEAEGEEDGQ